jgi:hypothetical protein
LNLWRYSRFSVNSELSFKAESQYYLYHLHDREFKLCIPFLGES